MVDWAPNNFPAWLRKVNKALAKQNRVSVGAANKADDAQATADAVAASSELVSEKLDQAVIDLATAQGEIDTANGRIDDAFVQVGDAQADANSAAAQAQAALTSAGDAQSTANSASTAASNAQAAADSANSAAAAAAGVAAAKADVLIQSSTPDASYQKATTLWIDTTGGANTPKRWNGTAWGAVTDKAATDAAAAAVAAQTTASDAATAASNAQSAANAAKTAADNAQSTANTANTAAGNAQTAADNANSAAASAAGIADGKADVLIQSTTPAASYQKATTLWIDTTSGGNTPKRWSGSAWTVVTDKAATDAASAAANAQTAASNAAQAASDAQVAANTAQAAANAAQVTANGKPQILFGTGTPTGTAPQGSTWFQIDSNGNIIGQWQQTAASSTGSTWTARQMTSSVIANLDVGKLTAGTAAIVDVVAQKIAASTANFQTANIANLFVTQGATMAQATIDALFAQVVQAHKITADMIDVGTLNGITLNGVSINGGSFTTTKATSTQPWVRMSSQSVTFYDGSDTMRGLVQAANGVLRISGTSDSAQSILFVGRTAFTVPGTISQPFTADVSLGDTYINGGDLMLGKQVRDSYSRTPMNQAVGGSGGGRRLVANTFTVPTTEASAADGTQIIDVVQYNQTDGKVYVYADRFQNRATGAAIGEDTGWTYPTVVAGTNDSNDPFRVRRINGVVYFGGLIAPTAANQTTINALQAQFRPMASLGAYLNRGGNSSTAGQWLVRVGSSGNVVLVGGGNSPGGSGGIDMAGFPPFPAAS